VAPCWHGFARALACGLECPQVPLPAFLVLAVSEVIAVLVQDTKSYRATLDRVLDAEFREDSHADASICSHRHATQEAV
jgi:hypothetical protein